MTVFVAVHHWDTPDNEGVEILGVFEKIEKARAQIVAGAGASARSTTKISGTMICPVRSRTRSGWATAPATIWSWTPSILGKFPSMRSNKNLKFPGQNQKNR